VTAALDEARALMRRVRVLAGPHCAICGRPATRSLSRRDSTATSHRCDEHDASELVSLGFKWKDLPGAETLRAADRFVQTGELPEVSS